MENLGKIFLFLEITGVNRAYLIFRMSVLAPLVNLSLYGKIYSLQGVNYFIANG